MSLRDRRAARDPDALLAGPEELRGLGAALDRLLVEMAALARALQDEHAGSGGPPPELASRVAPLGALAAPDDPETRWLLGRRRRWQRLVRENAAFCRRARD